MKKSMFGNGIKALGALLMLTCSGMVFAQTTSTFSGIGNWSDGGNWDNGIPIATTNVIVGSGSLTIDGIYTCNDLTINSGAVLTISAGNGLTVSGTLTNNAGILGLVIESDTSGSGQLLNNTAGVKATIKQLLVKDQWHFMGLPITYLPDAASVFNNCYVLWIHENNAWPSDFYSEDESTWHFLSAEDSLIKLRGYAIQHNESNDLTVSFQGTLNTGIIDTNFNSAVYGWNFISNPYTASIDWSLYSVVSSLSDYTNPINGRNMNDAFYVWKPELNTYGSYVNDVSTNGQSQYIPPTQGFFIQVTNVSSSISFTNDCKVIQSTEHFSSYNPANNDENTEIIKLTVSENNLHYDETVIYAQAGATDMFDQQTDAVKLKALESKLPQLYTVMNGQEYSINALPELNDQTIIPIRVFLQSDKKQTLSLKESESSTDNRALYLYDASGKLLADIKAEPYEFSGKSGETCSFYLAFSKMTSNEIPSLHQMTETDLAGREWEQVHYLNQGTFEVQSNTPISK